MLSNHIFTSWVNQSLHILSSVEKSGANGNTKHTFAVASVHLYTGLPNYNDCPFGEPQNKVCVGYIRPSLPPATWAAWPRPAPPVCCSWLRLDTAEAPASSNHWWAHWPARAGPSAQRPDWRSMAPCVHSSESRRKSWRHSHTNKAFALSSVCCSTCVLTRELSREAAIRRQWTDTILFCLRNSSVSINQIGF